MSQFNKFAWKLGTQNLVATSTLTLRRNLEHFPKSILGKLYTFEAKWSKKNVVEFEIHYAFRTQPFDFELDFSLSLISLKLTSNSPKFRT